MKTTSDIANPSELEQRVQELLRHPQNMGEMRDADAIGTVGNSSCGEFMRIWVKFKEQNGRKVIDRATFQSFGCETAIAVASLATEMIRGKTANEAFTMSGGELAGELGPLPPMKIHCAELVEGALRAALDSSAAAAPAESPERDDHSPAPTLMDSFARPGKVRLVMLPRNTRNP
jgi:NifU-like protein involved in Fe-S cluster formation